MDNKQLKPEVILTPKSKIQLSQWMDDIQASSFSIQQVSSYKAVAGSKSRHKSPSYRKQSSFPLPKKMAKVTVLLCFCVLAVVVSVNAHTEKGKVGIYELKRGDMSLKFTNWGATLVSFVLPDKNGRHCYSSCWRIWFQFCYKLVLQISDKFFY